MQFFVSRSILPLACSMVLLAACTDDGLTEEGDTIADEGDTSGTADTGCTGGTEGTSGTEGTEGTGETGDPADPCDADNFEDEVHIWQEGCEGESTFAWVGDACREVCECVGPDCASFPTDWSECIDAHLECPPLSEGCPFDEATVMTTGHASYNVGAFGLSPGVLRLRLAGNSSAFVSWHFVEHATFEPFGNGVSLTAQVPDPLVPGSYPVSASFWDGFYDASGTLEITELSLEGAAEDHLLVGTLDTASMDTELSGSFTVPGCAVLSN